MDYKEELEKDYKEELEKAKSTIEFQEKEIANLKEILAKTTNKQLGKNHNLSLEITNLRLENSLIKNRIVEDYLGIKLPTSEDGEND